VGLNAVGYPNMSVTDALRRVEVALGARYPASFHARAAELVALAATSGFQRAFPGTRLLLDAEEVRGAFQHLGGRLVPFMRSTAAYPDFYAFEPGREGAEPRVVVWCVHTTVHDWSDFAQFLSWVRDNCDKASPST
jgi:hypothetical protein